MEQESKEKRSEHVQAMVRPSIKRELESFRALAGRSMSDYVNQVLVRHCKARQMRKKQGRIRIGSQGI